MCGDFRARFLRKLSYSEVWVPQARQPPRHGTGIIFDWDDTLLCTSFLVGAPRVLPPRTQEILRRIARAGRRVLLEAQQLGQVFIVTNAMSDWVDDSARRWLPELAPVLDGIQVISAREKFEAHYPTSMGEWKLRTFMEVQHRLGSHAVTNFVSVGDSMFELDAATAVGKMFPQAIIKTVKFGEDPSPKQLLRELEAMGSELRKIVASGTGVRVTVEP